MDIATFAQEKKLREQGVRCTIGIDEAGRGPLAGPVVAAAVTLRTSQIPHQKSQTNHKLQGQNAKSDLWDLVRDSKTLSEKQRESIFDFIHKHFYVGIGVSTNETIDHINILEATFLAMKKALTNLHAQIGKDTNDKIPTSPLLLAGQAGRQNAKMVILVDGNKDIPNLTGNQKAIVQGDKKVKSIAAASIIAKVTRDRMMIEYDAMFPAYGFIKHKGYGTALHIDMLKKHGACPIHRKSFAPVKRVLH